MHRILLIIFICFIPGFLLAQKAIAPDKQIDTVGKKDLVDIGRSVFNISPKPPEEKKHKSVYFSFLPLSYSVPGGGQALFTSTTAGFYTGDPNTTYLSTVSFAPYFNFHARFGIPILSMPSRNLPDTLMALRLIKTIFRQARQ